MKSNVWDRQYSKIIKAVSNLLNVVIDHKNGSTIRKEGQLYTSALLEYGKSKLLQPVIENQKSLADIETLFALKEKSLAEARKINAEAKSIEIDNIIKQIKLALAFTKLRPVSEKEDEIVMLKNIQEFLETVQDIQSSKIIA